MKTTEMNGSLKYIWLVLTVLLSTVALWAQTGYESEEELKVQAEQSFEQGDYISAMPLYSQLVALYPQDPEYNYRFGACLLFADSDKEAPIKYLKFAANKHDVDPEVFYFLGYAYHLNYRFDDAIKAYKQFKATADKKEVAKYDVDLQIQQAGNGKELLRNISDLVVMDRKILGKSDFYRSYELGAFNGKLIRKPEEFKSSIDKKKGYETIMYFDRNSDQVYFSSYGEKGKTGKDIYYAKRLPNGDWGKPQPVPAPINTAYDEDYPFIHPNGEVMYFCSKGHNSMGGYDIFKSYYDKTTATWGEPVNLDFAINTPDDDILYITDMDEKQAFFASNRSTVSGEIVVYKIAVQRIPVGTAIVKGQFDYVKTKSAKITIEDAVTGKMLGIYNTNTNNGDYILNLPNGGNFNVTVETDAGPVKYKGTLKIPRMAQLSSLRQEMKIIQDGDAEHLEINNFFDEQEVAGATILEPDVLRHKADLTVNYNEVADLLEEAVAQNEQQNNQELAQADTHSESNDSTEEPDTGTQDNRTTVNLSNDDIVKEAVADAKNLQEEADEARSKAMVAYAVANEKNKEAKELSLQADALEKEAASIANVIDQQNKLDEANQVRESSEKVTHEAVAAYNIAHEKDRVADEKQADADQALTFAEEIKAAEASKSLAETEAKVKALQSFLEKTPVSERDLAKATTGLMEDKRSEAEQMHQKSERLNNELAQLIDDIDYLRNQAEKTKDKAVKEELLNQANEYEEEKTALKEEIAQSDKSAAKLDARVASLEKSSDALISMNSQINNSSEAEMITLEQRNQLANEIENLQESIKKSEDEQAIAMLQKEGNQTNETAEANVTNTTEAENETQNDVVRDFENELAALDSEADPLKKAEQEQQLYKEWSNALDKQIMDQKEEMDRESSKSKRKKMEKELVALQESASRVKEDQAAAEAEYKKQLLEQQLVADNQNNANEAVSTDESTTEQADIRISDTYNKYESAVKSAYATDDPAERASTLADINDTWSGEMKAEAAEYRTKAVTEQDPEKADAMMEKADKIEALAEERASMVESYYAIANKAMNGEAVDEKDFAEVQDPVLMEANLIAYNEDNQNNTEPDYTTENTSVSPNNETTSPADEQLEVITPEYEQEYRNKMALAEQIEDPVEKANTMVSVNEQWLKDVRSEINDLKKQLKKATSKEEKQRLLNRINSLEEYAKSLLAKIELLKQQAGELAQNQNTANTAEDQTVNNETLTTDASITSPLRTDGDPEAARIMQLAAQKENEATALRAQAEQTKKKKEKQALIEQAESKENEADSLKKVASLLEQQWQIKQEALAALEKNGLGEQAPSVTAQKEADQLNDELNSLNADVQSLQFAVDNTSDKREKEMLQQELDELKAKTVIKKQAADAANMRAAALKEAEEEWTAGKAVADNGQTENTHTDRREENTEMTSADERPNVERNATFENKIQALDAVEDTKEREAAKAENYNLWAEDLNEQIKEMETAMETADADQKKSLTMEMEWLVSQRDMVMQKAIESQNRSDEAANEVALADNGEQDSNADNTNDNSNTNRDSQNADSSVDAGDNTVGNATADNLSENNTHREEAILAPVEDADASEHGAEFQKQINNASDISDPLKRTQTVADIQENWLGEIQSEMDNLQEAMNNTTDEDERARLMERLQRLERLAQQLLNRIQELERLASEIQAEENLAANNQDDTESSNGNTSNLEDHSKNGVNDNRIAVNEQNDNNATDTPERYAIEDNTIDVVPPVLDQEIFDVTANPAVSHYDEQRPIPVQKSLPRGIVFKVQIGAFRNAIPQNLFKGFAPISADRLGDGITRYTSGLFPTFPAADQAKTRIRSMGYYDAFVVAYCNGKRIPVTQGRNGEGCSGAQPLADNSIAQPLQGLTESAGVNAVPVNREGLFYTVQIGAFSRAASLEELHNISPLNEDRFGGLIRYSTGVFQSEQAAINRKQEVVQAGVSDAFVTAYFNGERISVARARGLQNSGNITEPAVVENTGQTSSGTGTGSETGSTTESNIHFAVQIGPYDQQVPVEEAAAILAFTGNGFEKRIDDNGLKIYLFGNMAHYEDAKALRQEMVAAGLNNALEVALEDDDFIDIETAIERTNQ